MINKSKLALIITLFVAMAILLSIIFKIINVSSGYSILFGISWATLNFLLFLSGYAYSIRKSNKIFLLFTLGGIGVRFLIMLSLVVISIKFLKVELLGFIFAFFIWYVFYMIFEISIVRRGLEGR